MNYTLVEVNDKSTLKSIPEKSIFKYNRDFFLKTSDFNEKGCALCLNIDSNTIVNLDEYYLVTEYEYKLEILGEK